MKRCFDGSFIRQRLGLPMNDVNACSTQRVVLFCVRNFSVLSLMGGIIEFDNGDDA